MCDGLNKLEGDYILIYSKIIIEKEQDQEYNVYTIYYMDGGVNMTNQLFAQVAAKNLSSVEIDKWSSNQHEFNGVASLKTLFGTDRKEMHATFTYWDGSNIPKQGLGDLTWYDARENHPTRTEFRLYYQSNIAIDLAQVNDLLIIGIDNNGRVHVIIARYGTSNYNMMAQLVGLNTYCNSFIFNNNVNLML